MIKLNQLNLINKGVFKKETLKKIETIKGKISENLPWWSNVNYKKLGEETEKIFCKIDKKLTKLLVLGIGGSALGTSSVLSALQKDEKVIILDNLDPEYCEKVFNSLDFEKTLINVVSKSGNTIETNTQLSAIEKILSEKNLSFEKHILITTGEEKNQLRDFANKNKIKTLAIPKEVGGRFSVFTGVSLFPLLFAGVDINNFLKGAIEGILDFQKNDFEDDTASKLAVSQFEEYKFENKNIAVYKTYSRKLIGLLDWNKQLLAESLGKNREIGITPIINLGSTDQHSQLQLHLEGPKDKHITFLSCPLKNGPITSKRDDFLHMKSFGEVQKAFLEATKKSFVSYGIGYQEIYLEEINEYSIAKYMIANMISVGLLGELFKINAYNQPAVEFGKVKAREILNKK